MCDQFPYGRPATREELRNLPTVKQDMITFSRPFVQDMPEGIRFPTAIVLMQREFGYAKLLLYWSDDVHPETVDDWRDRLATVLQRWVQCCLARKARVARRVI
jgi:hypothetical protein